MDQSAGRVRLHHYDYLRVVCVLLIITIHASDPVLAVAPVGTATWWGGAVATTVSRVGLPLFFMLSGALVLDGPAEPIGATYRKRLVRVVVPLFVYSAIYVLAAARHELTDPATYLKIIPTVVSGPAFYHLWFVYALVGLYLSLPFLKGMVRGLADRDLAVLCGIVALYFALRCYLPAVGMTLGTSEFTFAGWAVYLILGYLLSKHWQHPLMRWMPLVGLAGFVCTLVILRWLPALSTELFAFSPTMMAMSAAMWWAAERGRDVLRGDRRVYGAVAAIAHRSYGIYLIHALVLSAVLNDLLGINAVAFHPALALPVTVVLTLLLSWVLAIAIDRTVADRLTQALAGTARRRPRSVRSDSGGR